ncbi:MerR family DNA-binding protein [Cytobacillus firmus]|jgi:DNA-binding transcriptional MerR regulator|uniref:MerR family DNA-binding protein n=1 Tax=Cytobacillus firmus TaxID=1399 RepID=UPI0018CE3E69|nr:MerR family DNA-binding protein [Cytobacillus firmus]MBG9444400.1 MerR family transcriptional regulator [Cytobacillus firmus]MBG9449384.1 MerR family transcriptional regulator [Cytobacillus firmus]USK39736.1 MerR family DNA-binding protein [Cytobacillus firmus]WHY34971.1 MerR family DNA-binding protein [Cytobacillus firmus]WHY62586.1 MerR family DNA-binding protein [Cytobacillus firmus]
MPEEKIFTISELAAMFDISSRTIRYYEEIGMLTSENRDSMTKQRTYTNRERRRLKMILRGKKLGFGLQEIREMIELYESNPEGEAEKSRIIAFADSKLREIEEQIMQLQMLREDILTYKAKYENSRVKT